MSSPAHSTTWREYNEIVLQLLRSEANYVFSGHALNHIGIHLQPDYLKKEMRYHISTMIPAEDMKSETHTLTIEQPNGWWQSFKKQYFPKKLLQHCPVKYTTWKETVTFTAYALFPKLPTVMPDCGDYRQIVITYIDNENRIE